MPCQELATAVEPSTTVRNTARDLSEPVLRRGVEDDAADLISMHARCSEDTIQRRYLAPLPHLSPRLAHALLTPDGGSSVVATRGTELIAVATFAPDHDGEHELGLLVEDRWQRRGLGSRLLQVAARQAATQGVGRLVCVTHPDNSAVLSTIRRAGFKARVTVVDGLAQATFVPSGGTTERRRRGPEMAEVTNAVVPLLNARGDLRDAFPVAGMIDQAVRSGA